MNDPKSTSLLATSSSPVSSGCRGRREASSRHFSFAALAQVVALLTMFNGLLFPRFAGAAGAGTVHIVALGDSLTAGYGVRASEAFPSQLSTALKAKGYRVDIANAGVSGDTSGGGLERLDWSVPEGTDAVILELGANDLLRGIDPVLTRKALTAIVTRLKARNIDVLVTGMRSLANWGPAYAASFEAIFPDLARANGDLFYPFFLDGVAFDPALNQPDGLHPNPKGVAEIVKRILPSAEELVKRVEQRRGISARS